MNTKNITDVKIYNASINGGNISDVKPIVENVIKRGNLEFLIICLHPYFTKDHGEKTSYTNQRQYWSSLGSTETIKLYIKKFFIFYGLTYDYFNDYGYTDFNQRKIDYDSETLIRQYAVSLKEDEGVPVNELSYKELKYVIDLARENHIKVLAYFYPYPYDVYVKKERGYIKYQQKMMGLFDEGDIVWDFNSDNYVEFRKDYSNYTDRAHLSYKGADIILNEIYYRLKEDI